MTATRYTVVVEAPQPTTPCTCGGCDWTGTAADTQEIDDCSLTPGDASPVGRCPGCGALAYIIGEIGKQNA